MVSENTRLWEFQLTPNTGIVKNKPRTNCPDGDFIQMIILDKVIELLTDNL